MYLTLDDRHDSTLLDGRGALETVSVDAFIPALAQRCFAAAVGGADFLTSEQLRLECHLIERVDGLVIVGLDLTCVRRRMLAILFSQSRWLDVVPGSRLPCGFRKVCGRRGWTALWRGVAEADDVDESDRSGAGRVREREILPSGTSSSPLSVAMIAVCSCYGSRSQALLET